MVSKNVQKVLFKEEKEEKFSGNQFTAKESQSTSLGKSSKTKDGAALLLPFQSILPGSSVENGVIPISRMMNKDPVILKKSITGVKHLLFGIFLKIS